MQFSHINRLRLITTLFLFILTIISIYYGLRSDLNLDRTIIILFLLMLTALINFYFLKNSPKVKSGGKMDPKVAEEMAKKIQSDAKKHRMERDL